MKQGTTIAWHKKNNGKKSLNKTLSGMYHSYDFIGSNSFSSEKEEQFHALNHVDYNDTFVIQGLENKENEGSLSNGRITTSSDIQLKNVSTFITSDLFLNDMIDDLGI